MSHLSSSLRSWSLNSTYGGRGRVMGLVLRGCFLLSWSRTVCVIVAVPLESRSDIALRYSPIFARRLALSHFLRSSVMVWVVRLFFVSFRSRDLFLLRDFLTCSMRSPSLQHSSMSPASHCVIMCRWVFPRDSFFCLPPLRGITRTTFSLAHASSALNASSSVLAEAYQSRTLCTHCPHSRRSRAGMSSMILNCVWLASRMRSIMSRLLYAVSFLLTLSGLGIFLWHTWHMCSVPTSFNLMPILPYRSQHLYGPILQATQRALAFSFGVSRIMLVCVCRCPIMVESMYPFPPQL